jgi:CRP-like cAMP-binding protein
MMSLERHHSFGPGEIIIHDGDCGDRFFLIESGSVQVFKRTATGHKMVIGKIPTGGIFGEMAVIDGHARMASVAALEPTICRIFAPELLGTKIAESDPMVRVIISLFMQHIRKLTETQIQYEVVGEEPDLAPKLI